MRLSDFDIVALYFPTDETYEPSEPETIWADADYHNAYGVETEPVVWVSGAWQTFTAAGVTQ